MLEEMIDDYIDLCQLKNKDYSWNYIVDALNQSYNARTLQKDGNGNFILEEGHIQTAVDISPFTNDPGLKKVLEAQQQGK
jgi:hypothetical protein